MNFTITFDTLISLSALLVALYSVWYTRRFNRPRIQIEQFDCDFTSHEFISVDFSVLNISSVPITIRTIEFRSNGKQFFPITDYDGPTYTLTDPLGLDCNYPVLNAEPIMLDEPITLFPNSVEEYRYYFSDIPDKLEIKVNTNRFLSIFSKNKSFVFRTNKFH